MVLIAEQLKGEKNLSKGLSDLKERIIGRGLTKECNYSAG